MQEPYELNEEQDIGVQQPQIPMYSPQVPAQILEIELNFDKTLDALQKKLSGMIQKLDGKQMVWVKSDKPWMNDDGVARIIAIIKGHIDVNVFLTQLMESDINHITWEIADEITTILSNKCTEFEIDPTYLGIIHSIIVNNIYFALKRAQNGTTLKQIHSITNRVENPMAVEQARSKERKGLLGRFF